MSAGQLQLDQCAPTLPRPKADAGRQRFAYLEGERDAEPGPETLGGGAGCRGVRVWREWHARAAIGDHEA